MDQIKTDQPAKSDFTTFLFHPTSVITMYLMDWGGTLFEIPQILSPVSLVLTFVFIFGISTTGIYFLQRHFSGETKKDAIIKAIFGGVLCALPTPIMSTFVGTIVLALSGFDAIKDKGLVGIIDMFKKY